MKGLAAAIGEALEAAGRLGCEDWLYAQHRDHAGRRRRARCCAGWSRAAAATPARRADEMAAAVAMLEELGVEPRVAAASEAWLRSLGRQRGQAVSAAGRPSAPASWCAAAPTSTCTSRPTWSSGASTTWASRAASRSWAWPASCSSRTTPRPPSAPRWCAAWCPGSPRSAPSCSTAPIGGMNPLAVEIAAREGARIGLDADRRTRTPSASTSPTSRPGRTCRCGRKLEAELRERGHRRASRSPALDDDGALLPETRAVLEVIAAHGMVLATGHLGREEVFADRGRGASRRAWSDDRGDPPRLPGPGLLGRGAARARRAGAR